MDHVRIATQLMLKRGFKLRKAVDKSKGCDHKIVLLYTDKGDFVYRYCTNDKAIMSHAYAIEAWSGLGLPKLVIKRKHFLIETMITGKDMSESRLTRIQKLRIMKKIGKIMRKMHQVRTERYGYMKSPGVGQMNSWRKYILRLTRSRMKGLPKDMIRKIERYLKDNAIDFDKPVLLHKDMNPENIMIYRGKLSGIVDAADALSGDPMYDIAIMYDRFRRWPREYPGALAKAYGKIDAERMRYYDVITLIKRIWARKEQGRPAEKYVQRLRTLLDG